MTSDISHAVNVLLEARRSGRQVTPPFALQDRDTVHAIQDGVAQATGPVAGWKTGARTPTAEPSAAPLLAGSLVRSPARFDGKAMHMIGVEVEISFHIVRDISPRSDPVGRDEALDAVGDAFVGMEVVDTRLADFKSADPEWLLADNQMNHALVIGDSIKLERSSRPSDVSHQPTAVFQLRRAMESVPLGDYNRSLWNDAATGKRG